MPDGTLIVGGGLAGLSCARELGLSGHDSTLFEAADRIGGLCRTDLVEGFSFDWTGHWLHARDPEMRALIEERWLSGNLLAVQRRARIHSEGVWTDFPYQFNLHGLPSPTVTDCIVGFVERPRAGPLRHAADFIERHLGAGFARHFMRPYNEKLFTVPCEELSPEWGGRFIPRPTLEEVVAGAVGTAPLGAGYNASFWYPREGGIEALARGVARDVKGEIRTSAPVQRIDLAARRIELRGGDKLPYRRLVYTGPLSAAARLADVEAATRLRAVSVTVVEVGATDAGGERFHWAYFPEPRFAFYRIGSPSEVNPRLAPPGCRSFALEFSHQGPVAKERLIESSIAALSDLGLLRPSEVRVARARTIQVAYVLFDQSYASARQIVLDTLADGGVVCAGRYGRWEYSSMEDALLSGREAARECSRS